MFFRVFKRLFGDMENATDEEKRRKGKNLVRIMFFIAITGIIASSVIPLIYQ